MNKTKLSLYFDSLIITTITSFILYIWINRYLKNAILSFFICIFIFILMFFIIFKHLTSKYNINKVKISEQKFADSCLNYLIYSNLSFDIKYFSNLLSSNHISNNIYKNNYANFYINLKSSLNEIDFHIANDWYQNTNKNTPLIFISFNQTDEFKNLLNNSPIKFYNSTFYDLFLLMKNKNLFPIQKQTQNNKFKIKKLNLLNSLTKNKFFKFFLSGLSLISLSIFIPFSFYYMIFGSILLLLSIFCLFNKKQSPITSNINLNLLTKKD